MTRLPASSHLADGEERGGAAMVAEGGQGDASSPSPEGRPNPRGKMSNCLTYAALAEALRNRTIVEVNVPNGTGETEWRFGAITVTLDNGLSLNFEGSEDAEGGYVVCVPMGADDAALLPGTWDPDCPPSGKGECGCLKHEYMWQDYLALPES
jgi:hypothetical protein